MFLRSIRKTTAEIQNYSFEKSSLERDSTSQDSGISQLSHLSFEKNKGEIKSLPLEEKRQKTLPNSVGTDVFMSPMEQADRATMQRILALFGKEDSESRKDAMRMLTQLMHQGAGNLIEDNFRPVFKHLVSCREDPDSFVRRQVFNLWATMLSTPRLLEEMENYADLILVNIFRAQRDQEREVRLDFCIYLFVEPYLNLVICSTGCSFGRKLRQNLSCRSVAEQAYSHFKTCHW